MKQIFAYNQVLRTEIQSYLHTKQQQADNAIPWGRQFLEQLEPFVTSGKLLRGSALCFCYQAYAGQAPSRAVLQTAIALELTHSALLVHDDIMDDDELRRGQPALHVQFGTNPAMAGGDAVFFLAFELLAQAQLAVPQANLHQPFVGQLLKTCTGQMQDIYLESRVALPSKQDIFRLMQAKTAGYTLALPLTLGATLAGRPASELKRLQAAGTAAGTIFQVRDDELGALGNPENTGKPVGSDIKQGKKTLLYYYLYKQSPANERRYLKMVFGNPEASEDDIAEIQKRIIEHGVPELLDNDIAKLKSQAYQHISTLTLSDAIKAEFNSLVDFCAARSA